MTTARILRGGLWAVSAALSVMLFSELARDALSLAVLAFLALALDALKLEAWNAYAREGRLSMLALAVALVALSLVASTGAASVLVAGRGATDSRASALAGYRAADLAALDARIEADTARLRILPADFSTSARRIAEELDRLRAERGAVVASIEAAPVAPGGLSFFRELSALAGIDERRLILAYLLAVAALLEAGIIALGPRRADQARAAGAADRDTGRALPSAMAAALASLPERPTVREAAAALGFHFSRLYRAIEAGRLPVIPGKPCRIERDRLALYLAEPREEGQGEARRAPEGERQPEARPDAPAGRLARPEPAAPILARLRGALGFAARPEGSPAHG